MSDPVDTKAISAFIRDQLLADPGQLASETTPLFTSGLLDSLALVELISAIERQYAIKISSQWRKVKHFDTVANISALVHDIRAATAPKP